MTVTERCRHSCWLRPRSRFQRPNGSKRVNTSRTERLNRAVKVRNTDRRLHCDDGVDTAVTLPVRPGRTSGDRYRRWSDDDRDCSHLDAGYARCSLSVQHEYVS